MRIDRLLQMADYVYPSNDMITPLIGNTTAFENRESHIIREIDLRKLLLLKEFLPTISLSMIDRTGLELWTMLRRMTWRISPSPIRLLSQKHEDPLSLWKLNRTQIVSELEKQNYTKIAEVYTNYYTTGWAVFFEKFSDYSTLRKLIMLGFEVMNLCLQEVVDK